MILDNLLLFSGSSNGATSVTGVSNPTNITDRPTVSGGTATSSNMLDLHMAGLPVLSSGQGARDIGIGDDPAMKILIVVEVALTGGTSLSITLQGAPDNGSGAAGSFVSWYATPVYTAAQLVAGARLMDMDMPRPPAAVGEPRFLQLLYTTVGAFTGGQLLAGLVLDRHDQMYQGTSNAVLGGYPAGITVAN